MQPRGRFAPSPSGFMHVGNAWTALLAWLDIRHQDGAMILRMEDLDPDRSRSEYAEAMMRDIAWLGLDWDEGPDKGGDYAPYRQSERNSLYIAAFEQLSRQGLLYPCFCTRAELRNAAVAPHAGESEFVYSGRCRNLPTAGSHDMKKGKRPTFRLKVADARITFDDELYGVQVQSLAECCGDFAIRRADGVFAYQFAVVVDDAAMKVSRVVRGADLLASTPRQIYLWQLLGSPLPTFLHVPLLLGPDGSRLSKRHGSLTIAALRNAGMTAEEIIGRLGCWAGLLDKPERVRAAELVPLFSPARLRREPVVVAADML